MRILGGDAGLAKPVPMRFFGFGLFWAWLFLVGVSPSALLGSLLCPGEVPFEMGEMAARTLLLTGVLAAGPRAFPTRASTTLLLVTALVGGTAAAPLLMLAGTSPAVCTAGAALAAAADVSLFLLWLSFFGYMRLGDALAMLVLSYAAGSLLYLAVVALGRNAMAAAATLLPAASCAAFVLCARFHADQPGTGGFVVTGLGGLGAHTGASQGGEPQESTAQAPLARSLARMTVCLSVYACVFALHCAKSFMQGGSLGPTFAVEPVCMVLTAGAFLVLAWRGKRSDGPYLLYRGCAPLIGLGVALDVLGAPSWAAFGALALGYVAFEVLALNDYCNIVHAEQASLLHSMARARLAISSGMLVGWCVAYFLPQGLLGAASVLSLLAVLLASTLVFSDRDVATVNAVADDRATAEACDARLGRTAALEAFSQGAGLTPREAEVLTYLADGRNASYIAEKLVVAESTVRAHVHSIYQKAGVSSRMQLLDALEGLREDREG